MWLLVGPGILAMLGENDGPSMISYATTGATYGLGFFLPFILVTFAMAVVCQEMCMRVGAVTHRGYGQLVLERFGPLWGWFAAGDLLLTNLVTLIAEFVAIRVGLAYFHLGAGVAAALGCRAGRRSRSAAGATGAGSGSCSGWRSSTACSCVAAIMVKPDWGAVGARAGDLLPVPGRQPQHPAAAGGLDDRRDRDPVDDLLPAERLGRQGPDAERPSSTAAIDTIAGGVLAAAVRLRRADRRRRAVGPRRREHPGARRRRVPRRAEARLRQARWRRCSRSA